MRFIKYNDIGDFAKVIKKVTNSVRFAGLDENGKAIFDGSRELPTIVAIGSEKIHGTNAAVCMGGGEFWVQSRQNIITPENDNHGCARWVYGDENNLNTPATKRIWIDIIHELAAEYKINLAENIISVYFEWSGGSVQKKSAFTGLGKRAIIFQHFKVSPLADPIVGDDGNEDETGVYWLETGLRATREDPIWIDSPGYNIFNIMNHKTWALAIDFKNPKLIQNELIRIVNEEVEPASPIGKEFGMDSNIGEGVVWTFFLRGGLHKFKVKGEKHAGSKVKTLKPVDNEKEQLKIDVAQKVTPAWRLEQMYDETFKGIDPDKSGTGAFLKAVVADIQKEELDNIADAGLEPKEIFPFVSRIAKTWFFDKLNEDAGL